MAAVEFNAPGRTDYDGEAIAEQQRSAYPDIGPVTLPVDTRVAFERALAAVEGMGWELLEADATAGRIEATDRTFWFGFADDVVIRISDAGGGASRIDARSQSRVGGGDLGANANRMREFLAVFAE